MWVRCCSSNSWGVSAQEELVCLKRTQPSIKSNSNQVCRSRVQFLGVTLELHAAEAEGGETTQFSLHIVWHVGGKTRAEWIKRHQQKKTLAVRKNLKWQQRWDLSRTSLKHFWALERCPLTTSPSSSSTNGKMSTFIFMFIATFFSSSSSFQSKCFTRSASFLIAASFLVGYSQYFGTPIHCEIVSLTTKNKNSLKHIFWDALLSLTYSKTHCHGRFSEHWRRVLDRRRGGRGHDEHLLLDVRPLESTSWLHGNNAAK